MSSPKKFSRTAWRRRRRVDRGEPGRGETQVRIAVVLGGGIVVLGHQQDIGPLVAEESLPGVPIGQAGGTVVAAVDVAVAVEVRDVPREPAVILAGRVLADHTVEPDVVVGQGLTIDTLSGIRHRGEGQRGREAAEGAAAPPSPEATTPQHLPGSPAVSFWVVASATGAAQDAAVGAESKVPERMLAIGGVARGEEADVEDPAVLVVVLEDVQPDRTQGFPLAVGDRGGDGPGGKCELGPLTSVFIGSAQIPRRPLTPSVNQSSKTTYSSLTFSVPVVKELPRPENGVPVSAGIGLTGGGARHGEAGTRTETGEGLVPAMRLSPSALMFNWAWKWVW